MTRIPKEVSISVITEQPEPSLQIKQHVIRRAKSWWAFLSTCARVRKLTQASDVIHVFDGWPFAVYGLSAVLGTKKKLIISGIGTYSVAPLKQRLKGSLLRYAYGRADAIPCISAFTAMQIRHECPRAPISVIKMGSTSLPLVSESQVAAWRVALGIPESAYPVVITVGEIKERKGQLDTLHGIKYALQKIPNAQYLIVGSDRDAAYIQKIRSSAERFGMTKQVHFIHTARTDADLACLYSLSHIVALNSNNVASHFEGFGLTILEGAGFGLPSIGSRDCGIEDAILDGTSGIMTTQHSHTEIGEALKRIASSYENFQSGAHMWYSAFSWEKTVAAYLTLYG
ncbi:glycosyltransferase family 4 protein [Patescibacteria group bacterium]|nr:glycosyltransferase family 4 protein [Patescibacteria group bacterium]